MELMRISTIPCHAGGTNPLLCRSAASKLYSFEASTQPAVVSQIFPRDLYATTSGDTGTV